MARAIGNSHRRYASLLNDAMSWSGHLWENRYFSTPLDERHLWAAVRYVENNPVRARLASSAEEWSGSSAAAHALGARDPHLARNRPFPGGIGEWGKWLRAGLSDPDDARRIRSIRANSRSGRPSGDAAFVRLLEQSLGRRLEPRAPGRPRKRAPAAPLAPERADLLTAQGPEIERPSDEVSMGPVAESATVL
jgi:putative transposase